jgi:hypothetical protein
VDAIYPAIEHTKKQLFQPFRFGQWTKLALVGLLAGELGSSGGCNRSNFNLNQHPGAHHFMDSGLSGIDTSLLVGLIAVLVVTGLVLGIVLMYISSVMRFILFDSVMAKECHIRQGWSRRQGPGLRYFLWKLGYLLLTLGGLTILVGIPAGFAFAAGWLKEPKEHMVPLVLFGIIVFFAALIFVLALAVIFVLTKDFVIPQMALEEIGAMEGWRRLWRMIKAEKGGYAAYLGMKIVMAIGAGIMVFIATMILALVIVIPTALLSILAIVTGKTAGLTWNAYTITLAVVVGCVLLAGFLYVIALISVPVIVFFPAYSIYFFAAPLSRVERGALSTAAYYGPSGFAGSSTSATSAFPADTRANRIAAASPSSLSRARELSCHSRCLMLQTRACQRRKRSRGAFHVVLNGRQRCARTRDQRHAADRCVAHADYRIHGRRLDGQGAGRDRPDSTTRSETDGRIIAITHGHRSGGVDEGRSAAYREDQSGRSALGGSRNAPSRNLFKTRGEGRLRARRRRR